MLGFASAFRPGRDVASFGVWRRNSPFLDERGEAVVVVCACAHSNSLRSMKMANFSAFKPF